jgi:hypothetical protein
MKIVEFLQIIFVQLLGMASVIHRLTDGRSFDSPRECSL